MLEVVLAGESELFAEVGASGGEGSRDESGVGLTLESDNVAGLGAGSVGGEGLCLYPEGR